MPQSIDELPDAHLRRFSRPDVPPPADISDLTNHDLPNILPLEEIPD